jgi:hypothetical protein
MLNKILELFKINENNTFITDCRYSYFTDGDLIDDTYYIYNLLFKKKSLESEDSRY